MVAGRLIALDKCPGVRPIGVGEVIQRIICKAVLSVLKFDILEAASSLQLCAGQDAGNEVAVHAMREVFGDSLTEAVLLVDASNAFNNLNRQATLHNMQSLCPSLATILITLTVGIFLYLLIIVVFSPLKELLREILWLWPCILLMLPL